MIEIFWEIVKPFIPASLRPKALESLEQAGMDKWVVLPGFGRAEREGRRILSAKGKEYNLTPAQMSVIINIATSFPSSCSHRQALRGIRSYFDGVVDKAYLRVVLSKIGLNYPELRKHIRCEKWSGYRWIEKP